MKHFLRIFIIGLFALSIGACARKPPPPDVDLAPAKRPLDAKTQLESGKRR